MQHLPLKEWHQLLSKDLQRPALTGRALQLAIASHSQLQLMQLLFDFDAQGYPSDTQWNEPLLQVFKAWVLRTPLRFSHYQLTKIIAIREAEHYQRVCDLAIRLSEKLALPTLHPGTTPNIDFANPRTFKFQLVQRCATWQTPEAHRAWLHRYAWCWDSQTMRIGMASTWPVFQHLLQWGVNPRLWNGPAEHTLLAEYDKWYDLPAVPTFGLWCFLQRATDAVVTVTAWAEWVSTLPAEHAAHTLAVPQAFQAYDVWATLQTPGQPENWLALLQMLEPAPDRVPTETGPVDDLAL